MRRLSLLLFTALVAVVLIGSPAGAQSSALDAAAQAFRSTSVYVDPAAGQSVDVAGLRERIRGGDRPIFIAVLPESAAAESGGSADGLALALGNRVRIPGTYAVLAGNTLSAASTVLPSGRAQSLAAASESRGSAQAVLEDFVNRVNAQAGTAPSGSTGTDGGSGGGGGGVLLLLLVLGGGGFFIWSMSRNKTKRAESAKEYAADRQLLQAELSVLGHDVMELEPHVTMHPEARPDYDAGVTRYHSAQAAMDYADDQVDLVRVERVIDEGRYAMDRARARIDGREPPPPPENLTRRGRHDEPALDVDERGEPVYVGYGGMPWYGGGGWFGGGSGLLTGLMLGQMLGGGFGGWGGGWSGQGEGGGDSGGGDWGGGDFGGGDFGGGDFGGGGDF